MFRDDAQTCRAVRVLLASVGLANLWTFDGPTARAVALLEANGGTLSSGEAFMLLVAFDVFNGHGNATIGRLLGVLDARRTELVAGLLVAVASGAEHVDVWLEQNETKTKLEAI